MSKDKATSQTDESGETSEKSEPSKPSKPSQTSKPPEQSEKSVKSEMESLYIYLTEDRKNRLDKLYRRKALEWEIEYEDEPDVEKLEKNRHYYQLVIDHGLDTVEELSAEEMRERLGL